MLSALLRNIFFFKIPYLNYTKKDEKNKINKIYSAVKIK